MQKAYINALYGLMSENPNVISCLSDSGTEYDELLTREFPNQVVNFGISENNLLGAAAGMAATGKVPFVYTTSAFIVYRSYEFLRDDICMQNRNVKLIGMGTGLSWSTLGPTHHTTEDLAALRALPNLTIITPASPKELEETIKEAYRIQGPVYIRMGMSNEKEIYEEGYHFDISHYPQLAKGNDTTIFSCGSIISEVCGAVERLKENGMSASVINVHTLKPLNKEQIIEKCKEGKLVYSVEEHNVNGGLGTIIADVIAEENLNVKLIKIGLEDCFAKGFGTREEVLMQNKLDARSIYQTILATR